MKILFLSTFESTGGAAIAATRLMHALQQYGGDVEVSMLCRKNIGWGPKFLRKQSWTSILERIIIWIFNGFSLKDLWATDIALLGQDITRTREYQEADVIHLHWINQGFISLRTIDKMIRDGKKIVWTMHDEWNAMGVFHLKIQYRVNLLEHRTWMRKKQLYSSNNIQFVTCSQWMKEEALNSALMKGQNIIVIPNPINIETFRPKPHPLQKKVLFVAQNANNELKGIKYLEMAKRLLPDVQIISLGKDIPYISNPKQMAELYARVDAFMLPSLSENLPNTIMEAMACGTPCVGFDVGGIPEMIDHLENGYVAKYRDAEDLAAGIRYVLDEANHERLSLACREKVKHCYSEDIIARKYLNAYTGNFIR